MKLSFKTIKPKGRYAFVESAQHYIKIDGKVVGQITDKSPYKIMFAVMKVGNITDDNTNSLWKWITLKDKPETLDAAKEYVKANMSSIASMYAFHNIE